MRRNSYPLWSSRNSVSGSVRNSIHRRRAAVLAAERTAPHFESLEPRELFSATFDDLTGTLLVIGSQGRDRIAVLASGDGRVTVVGASSPGQATVFTGVQAIEVHGLGGSDDIFVGNVVDPLGDLIGVVVDGGGGNDTIVTGLGDDIIDAGSGNNKVFSDGGDDRITTGAGKDLIDAGSGDDEIDSGDGADKIFAGSGANLIDAGDGKNIIVGGPGNDDISAGDGNDLIFADGGDDLIDAGDGKNSIEAGSGDDTITTGGGADRIFAGPGEDTVFAGDGNNIIDGGSGFDEITAGAGNDTIFTGDGDDLVDAGLGNNRINRRPRAFFRFSFGLPPRFVIARPLSLIASIGTRGLSIGSAGIIVHSFGLRGVTAFPTIFDSLSRAANPIFTIPAFNFTALFVR